MSSISVGRILVVILTAIILLIALALCIASVATPAWQVVYLAEFGAEHNHGLWLDCTVNRRYNQGKFFELTWVRVVLIRFWRGY